ncbi:MAG: choice-of-anchor J domain-containing protein [Muribaculaceae bacterium]|nr:choice-of-anchor J domain-containing protein [Muribaculaceae bacterium]
MKLYIKNLLVPAFGLGAVLTATAAGGPARLGERNPLKPPFIEEFDEFPVGSEYETFDRYFQWINSDGDKNPSGSDRSWGLYNFNGESNGRQYSKAAYLQYPLEVNRCDDWLIPRAIRLEAGKYYLVRMDASLFLDNSIHSMEVKMGEYNDAEGMTFSVIPQTDITSINPKRLQGWFVPEFDGLYYMGIHGTSDRVKAQGGYLFVDNIGIEAARSGCEPDTVTSLKFVSDPDGTPSALISFTLPEKAIDGTELSGKIKVTVNRDGNPIKTIEGTPGQEVEFTDAVKKAGYYKYTITVSNEHGSSCETNEFRFVGTTTPMAPANVMISETESGEIHLKWEAPTTDLNGTPINPDKVTYNIYEVLTEDYDLKRSNYSGTEATIDLNIPEGTQRCVEMIVTASLNNLESTPTGSDFIFVGTPDALPYTHHFMGSDDENVLGSTGDDDVRWRYLDDFSDPKSQDGDGGYICMVGTTSGQKGTLSTGKIDFSKSSNPYVSFYTYIYEEDENVITINAEDSNTGEYLTLGEYELINFDNIGWTRVVCPLKELAGKTARLIIGVDIVSHGYVPFDNMLIDELPLTDLSVERVNYPESASDATEYTVTALITNMGADDVESYTVSLICEGKTVDTKECGPLASFDTASIELTGRFSPSSSEMPLFIVEVSAEGDEIESNDKSAPFNITYLASNLPAVSDLKGEESDKLFTLSWSAPDLSKAAPQEATEDFEKYEEFSTTIDGFTMIDADGGNIVGFKGMEMPVTGTPQAFWTMRSDGEYSFIKTLGNSSLLTMATVDANRRPTANDDWLVSPELYGGRQTIGFSACAQTTQYGPETFEVYVSTTTPEIKEFKLIKVETEVFEEWTRYHITLPLGSKYFAIRCTSDDKMMFTIDDITYIPTGDPQELLLLGYNIYCNDEKLNESPVNTTTFVTPVDNSGASYYVTAVYDKGESVASNIVAPDNTGVEWIANEDSTDVYYDINGLRIGRTPNEPGVYIRRHGKNVEKVIVR